MRPIITVSAVVLLHLCVIAVLVGVNGCRSTSGYEKEPDLSAYSAGGRAATPAPGTLLSPAPGGIPGPVPILPTPKPTKPHPITAVGAGGTHTVVKGESLSLIALREKVSIDDLASANGLSRSSLLREGQKLKVPAPGAAKKAAPKSTPTSTTNSKAPVAPAAPAITFEPLKITRFSSQPTPPPVVPVPASEAPAPAPVKK